jgi:hypothetical protein
MASPGLEFGLQQSDCNGGKPIGVVWNWALGDQDNPKGTPARRGWWGALALKPVVCKVCGPSQHTPLPGEDSDIELKQGGPGVSPDLFSK